LSVKLPAIIITAPAAGSVVSAKDEKNQDVELQWQPIPGAVKYRVNAKSTTTEWAQEQDVSATSTKLNLPVGQAMEWNVTAIDEAGQLGEVAAENYKFELHGPPLQKPTLTKPFSKFVREVTWETPPYTKNYSYDFKYLNPRTKKWETVEKSDDFKDHKLKMDTTRPSGRYRISVQAHGERRDDSPKVAMEFTMRGGFRDPAALDTAILRDSIVKPTNYYAIASYMLTQINYEATDAETNTKPAFPALGGTGRVGLGYQPPESLYGGFAIVDMSGFIINGKNFKFSSMELHATEKIEFGQKGILLLGAGLFTKELPIVKGTNQFGFSSVGKVRNTGPHAGLTYWLPLNDRYGLQLNGRAYYSLLGSSANGQKVDPAFSMQGGILGSYRLNRNWMGYAGYAYRLDQAQYGAVDKTRDPSSFASPGEKNTIIIQGHYLNLVLDVSF
jgi:hypothetical protein